MQDWNQPDGINADPTKQDDRYVDSEGYAIRHVKCQKDMLLRTAMGRVPYCENCGHYVVHPTEYERYKK